MATEHAGVLADLLTSQARAAALHALSDHRADESPLKWGPELTHDVVEISAHHIAAVLVSEQAEPVGHGRDEGWSRFRRALSAKGGSQDGAYFNANGLPERIHRWQLLPDATVVELDAGRAGRLRVLVSLQLARDNQRTIFAQAVPSVLLALGLVLVVVMLILRQPRRSLAEANQYAAQLPFGPLQPLAHDDAGLAAIDTLRGSLNSVGRLLEQQRLQHRIGRAPVATGRARSPGCHRCQEHLPRAHEP